MNSDAFELVSCIHVNLKLADTGDYLINSIDHQPHNEIVLVSDN